MHNQPLLPDNFSTAVRFHNCRKASRYVYRERSCLEHNEFAFWRH